MSGTSVVAVDLGASSGRVILVTIGRDVLELEPVARFANRPVVDGGRTAWDIQRIRSDVVEGLRRAIRARPDVSAVGVDAWGVDYALSSRGELLASPVHYRDPRGVVGLGRVHDRIDPANLYRRNGLQQLPINTIYQLAAEQPELLDRADALLLIPDLVSSWLSGEAVAERTIASTTGLLDADARSWDPGLCALAGVPTRILPDIVDAGVVLSPVRADVLPGRHEVRVVAVGAHDTASAVAAVPLVPEHAAFISCGTWGLVGVELDAPVIDERSFAAGFTNEAGVGGRRLLLRNTMGLWLLTEAIDAWGAAGEGASLASLLDRAALLSRHDDVLDVDDPDLAAPGQVPERIAAWFTRRGARPPSGPVETVRCIVDGLADAFARNAAIAAELGSIDLREIHIVGGGSLNSLLCQEIADRSGIPVVAGPVEATAVGSALVQAAAVGALAGGLDSGRRLVGATVPLRRYSPRA